jgi:hypothetical protein
MRGKRELVGGGLLLLILGGWFFVAGFEQPWTTSHIGVTGGSGIGRYPVRTRLNPPLAMPRPYRCSMSSSSPRGRLLGSVG